MIPGSELTCPLYIQARGTATHRLNRTVIAVELKNTAPRISSSSVPQPPVVLFLHSLGQELGPAKWTRPLVAVHPAVQAAPVEDVLAVLQLPDLLPGLELVQADRAALGRVRRLPVLHQGQEFLDQDGGHGRADGRSALGERRVDLEEIREAQEAEEGGDEDPDEAEEGDGLEQELR